MHRSIIRSVLGIVFCQSLAGCGAGSPLLSQTFGSLPSLTWLFQCPDDLLPVPTASPDHPVLVDAGPFPFAREKLVGTPVAVSGRVCPVAKMQRDIVFVIDVSGSMGPTAGNSDPDTNNGTDCGRLDAVNAVIAKLPLDITNFGLLTFDTSIEFTTTGLLPDPTSLTTAITAGGKSMHDILCFANTGTDYGLALDSARTLLAGGRQTATKEILFVSDGAPNDQTAATAAATDLKTNGVVVNGQQKAITIAAVMLGTDATAGTYMQTNIASVDAAGNPIYAAATDAGQLADILSGLADNKLVGSTLTRGGNAAPTPAVLDLVPLLQGNDFTVPPFMLDINGQQTSYNMTFQYWDSHQNTYSSNGVLTWAD